MSCYISNGVTNDSCAVGVGGIAKIYVAGGGQITGYTYNATDEITGATSTTGTTIYEFQLKRGVSDFTQTITKSYENGSLVYDGVLNISLFKMDAEKRNMLLLLAVNEELQVIAVDGNGVQYMLGIVNYASLSGSVSSGTALTDKNGFDLTFTTQEAELAPLISGDLATVFADATIA